MYRDNIYSSVCLKMLFKASWHTYIIMLFAIVLAPKKHQATNNNHVNYTANDFRSVVIYQIHITSQPINEICCKQQYLREGRELEKRWLFFLLLLFFYRRVRLLAIIMTLYEIVLERSLKFLPNLLVEYESEK